MEQFTHVKMRASPIKTLAGSALEHGDAFSSSSKCHASHEDNKIAFPSSSQQDPSSSHPSLEQNPAIPNFLKEIGDFYNNASRESDVVKYDLLGNFWKPDIDFPFPVNSSG